MAVAALGGFALFKGGMVRFDAPHLAAYFSTMVVFWLAIPWGATRRLIPAFGAIAMMAITLPMELREDPGQAWDQLNPVNNVERAFTETEDLFDSDQRSEAAASARASLMADYALNDQMLAELEGHTVREVEPGR